MKPKVGDMVKYKNKLWNVAQVIEDLYGRSAWASTNELSPVMTKSDWRDDYPVNSEGIWAGDPGGTYHVVSHSASHLYVHIYFDDGGIIGRTVDEDTAIRYMSPHKDELDIEAPIATAGTTTTHKCYCDTVVLLREGCLCGGV